MSLVILCVIVNQKTVRAGADFQGANARRSKRKRRDRGAGDLFAMFHVEHHAANAADLAEAMDAWGYCEERAMTRLYPLRYTAADRRTYVCIAAYGSAMLALSLIL